MWSEVGGDKAVEMKSLTHQLKGKIDILPLMLTPSADYGKLKLVTLFAEFGC